jgi:DNA-binding MarR family transcriptional regulator
MTDPLERYSEDERRRVVEQTELRREKLRPLREVPHPFGTAAVEPATAERWIERGGRSE